MHPEIGTVFAAAMIVGIPKTALRPLEILIPPGVCHLICCNVSRYLTWKTKINKYISFTIFFYNVLYTSLLGSSLVQF